MSITGQVGHISLVKQTGFGDQSLAGTATNYKTIKITGESLVAGNNMLVAEGEIGIGRDVTQAVPGGFSAAGAINGNLRARAAAALLYGSLGTIAQVAATGTGATATVATDTFTPADVLPLFSVEKKVGTNVRSANELLSLRYTDSMINTLNISANGGAISTFSAGIVSVGETYLAAPVVDETAAGTYSAGSDDLLVFHGGRIRTGDTGGSTTRDDVFQSLEIAINNNVQTDEYTIRPSRYLRSLTEGIRTIEANMTVVFDSYDRYQKYTYGASGRSTPGYSLYMGQLDFTLANWQMNDADNFALSTGTGTGDTAIPATNAQAIHVALPKVAFAGLPVSLNTGRIVVSTTARALKPTTGAILTADVRPSGAAW